MEKLYSLIDSYYDSMVATLEKMVNIDSGADCPEGIKAVAEIVGNALKALNFDVDAHDGVAVIVLIGRERGLGGHGEDAVHRGGEGGVTGTGGAAGGAGTGGTGGGVAAAAGGQAGGEGQGQDQSQKLLHLPILPFIQICR